MFPIVMLDEIKVKLHCHYREKDIEEDKEIQFFLCKRVSDEVTQSSKVVCLRNYQRVVRK